MEQQAEYTSTDNNIANKTFESLLTKRIYDDIHGFVALTEDEKKLLSHPYMRRLHFIKQNALANFIFPGATHTRFSHSVGVLYIVEKMVQKLKTLPKEKIDITPIDHQVVRLAALLHDVGHYPLSHTIEDCFKKYDRMFLNKKNKINIEKISEYSETSDVFFGKIKNNIKDILQDFPEKADAHSDFNHENIAKILISDVNSPLYKIVAEILKNTYRYFNSRPLEESRVNSYLGLIGSIICGKLFDEENEILSESLKNKEKYFILSLLINSDLDADQMDYMLRDTKNTGIETTIRTDFLIDNLDVCYVEVENYMQPMLCFNYKAFESVQQFLLSKEYWYTEIIYYNKINILNRIAQRLYMYVLYQENRISSLDDFKNKILFNTDEYLKFTDNEFWNKILKLRETYKKPIIAYLIDILIGNKSIPEALTIEQLEPIMNDQEIAKCLKTNMHKTQIPEYEKNKIYDYINKRFNDSTKFPIYFSNKFIKPIEGELQRDPFIDRSIHILCTSCDKKQCNRNCLKAYSMWNTKKLGKNILHRLMNLSEDIRENIHTSAYIEKCVIYKFELYN